MRAFLVPQGTKVWVQQGQEWSLSQQTTEADVLYFEEDVDIDPLGKYAPIYPKTVGGDLAKRGYYGFRQIKPRGKLVIAHTSQIQVV
jgi:hypothetical protein